jgi:hypothetical protein
MKTGPTSQSFPSAETMLHSAAPEKRASNHPAHFGASTVNFTPGFTMGKGQQRSG